jgi:phosphotransferase system enzyme I (PtsI)
MKTIKGTPISPGVVIGKVYLKNETTKTINLEKGKNKEEEKKRFQKARLSAIMQVEHIYNQMLFSKGEKEAAIFNAHREILDDAEFFESVEMLIDDLECNSEWAVKTIEDRFVNIFQEMEQDYMKERAMDIKDICARIIRILQGDENNDAIRLAEPSILISKDLTPSDTAQMIPEMVLGIINETGGTTSHAAIIARMLGIPLVVYPQITSIVENGQAIAFDGEEGTIELVVNETVLLTYSKKQEVLANKNIQLEKLKGTKSVTTDGYEIQLAGNIGIPKDMEQVLQQDCHSIGLFRTEFLYMNREDIPTEEEQFIAYKQTAEKMNGNPVIIRTMDIGGDKELDYLQIPKEENPFLGCRAIRFCLKRVSLWKAQLRALLRASAYGNIHIMFPMIVSMDELLQAKQILEEVKSELKSEGIALNENIPVGMMMETPAAAIMADVFAQEVDFFSIGTNDLIQYTMAVDRMNGQVAHLYSQYDPAVLRFIKNIADRAHEYGTWVGICGEAAADKKLLPLWVGFGIDELSMSPGSILQTRGYIQELSKAACDKVVSQIFELKTAREIEEVLKKL